MSLEVDGSNPYIKLIIYLFICSVASHYSADVTLCMSGVIQDSQKAAVARSFSLSWKNQGEQGGPGGQEPMRIRSATTSGAPGVEKARNNVRQKASGKYL